MGDVIKLNNGEIIVKMFGKYEPNMVFILSEEYYNTKSIFEKVGNNEKNMVELFDALRGNIWYNKGTYFISKKNNKCFKIDENNGKDLIVKVDCGRYFSDYGSGELKAGELVEKKLMEKGILVYKKRSMSNGGGSGYVYYVFKNVDDLEELAKIVIENTALDDII